MAATDAQPPPALTVLMREWGRIGVTGFGGPPAHIALLRELCVTERGWLTEEQFERAIGAANLLPGPASTQLAIYCAWRLRGPAGALVGGVSFIVPGLVLILALSSVFLSSAPPRWIRGAGMGAGAAVAPVALLAGLSILPPMVRRAAGSQLARLVAYAGAGGVAAATVGPWLVVVLLACGLTEFAVRHPPRSAGLHGWPLLGAVGVAPAGVGALAWTALKVGALAFGGGFVIVPLMQADAVNTYHWMTHGQFLNAVALGQITPGPVVLTIAAVGYSAAGIAGGLLATVIAFTPSFGFVLIGASRFDRLLSNQRASAFLAGAGPAAAGAIIGSAIPLAAALGEAWQYAVLALAAIALLALRRGVVATLLGAGAVGAAAALLGAPVPH